MSKPEEDNPFYHNYVFTKKDMDRCQAKWWHKLDFLMCQTYVQISEGYAVFFKQKNNKYLITKFEKLPEIKL